ncbi:proline dehydrogenase 1 [bacterium BMS3Abin05]|nr:proline dehydrogenase 1 [bacterium BMS3Abin05]GBE28811.1 proline dehydrogenase 1 [bacterium BMS3Bbin03]HDK35473.1 proline dehydrogenase [Bacteroidota bacterium]HDZ11690.1 proline dehydrogenase [Bacteroidota bacterium]
MNLFNSAVVAILPLLPKSFVSLFSGRYIAGETLEDAVKTIIQLNKQNIMATQDLLGENITRKEEATQDKEMWFTILDAIEKNKLDSNISIKLTQLGLKLDKEFCFENVREIVEYADRYKNFVRIDMEDSTCTDDTLDILYRVRRDFTNVGIVIQAYLKRSEQDLKELTSQGINVRICKGIYNEAPEIAFKKPEEIRQNYLRLLMIMFDRKCYVGIATHDRYLIEKAIEAINTNAIPNDRYEFQMLLGVGDEYRTQLVQSGHRLRVYVPFGKDWFPYSLRRMKENPKVAGYVIKNLFKKI